MYRSLGLLCNWVAYTSDMTSMVWKLDDDLVCVTSWRHISSLNWWRQIQASIPWFRKMLKSHLKKRISSGKKWFPKQLFIGFLRFLAQSIADKDAQLFAKTAYRNSNPPKSSALAKWHLCIFDVSLTSVSNPVFWPKNSDPAYFEHPVLVAKNFPSPAVWCVRSAITRSTIYIKMKKIPWAN